MNNLYLTNTEIDRAGKIYARGLFGGRQGKGCGVTVSARYNDMFVKTQYFAN